MGGAGYDVATTSCSGHGAFLCFLLSTPGKNYVKFFRVPQQSTVITIEILKNRYGLEINSQIFI